MRRSHSLSSTLPIRTSRGVVVFGMFFFGFSKQHLDNCTLGHNSSRLHNCFSSVDILATGESHFCTWNKRDLLVLLASKYETIPAFTNLRFDRPDTSRIANPSAKYHQPVVADMFVLDALHFIECGGAFLRRSLNGRKGDRVNLSDVKLRRLSRIRPHWNRFEFYRSRGAA